MPRKMPRNSAQTRYDEDAKAAWSCGSWCEYIFVVVLSSILLLASIILTVVWLIYYRGGYSLEDKNKLFNFHPTLMIAGYITFSGFSILLYRICRCCSHLVVKLCHVFFHACAIPCVVIGGFAIWEYKEELKLPHFYSLHSWLGFITSGLFAFQFVIGFFSFLILLCCENATQKFRSTMVPIHASLGLATFMLAVATAVTGLTQKALHDLSKDDQYSGLVDEAIFINTIAVILVALGILIPFAIRRSNSPASFRVYVTEHI